MVTPENVLERNEGEKCNLWRNAERERIKAINQGLKMKQISQ